MASSPSYQLRHSIMHLNKVLGTLSTLTEKQFHGEAINETALELAERRLPDLQAFILKIASVAGLRLNDEFGHFGKGLQEAFHGVVPEPFNGEWLETRLIRFEEAMATFTKIHGAVIAQPRIPAAMRKDIRTALGLLQGVALDLAHYLQVDLDRNYRDRLLAVEHRKLA